MTRGQQEQQPRPPDLDERGDDGDRDDECPGCGHERGKPRGQDWYVRLFRLKPRPARCRLLMPDETGWGAQCNCADPFHGS